jgi:hypothetical protein
MKNGRKRPMHTWFDPPNERFFRVMSKSGKQRRRIRVYISQWEIKKKKNIETKIFDE